MQIRLSPRIFFRICVLITLFLLVAVMPVSAYVVRQNITQGATIFIGESGLNLTAAIANGVYYDPAGSNNPAKTSGDKINPSVGWWASAATISTTSPTLGAVTLTGINDFTVSPSVFGVGIGNWYLINKSTGFANIPAVFTVADPTLGLSIWDFGSNTTTVNNVASGKSVVQGEYLGFKIVTNQWQALGGGWDGPRRWSQSPSWTTGMSDTGRWIQMNNASEGYIDITVKDTSGTTLTGLLNASTSTGGYYNTLLKQNVSFQSPNWIWGTAPSTYNSYGMLANWSTGATDADGHFAYPTGTYYAYATSKLNSMNDNYKLGGASYTGKTVSAVDNISIISKSDNGVISLSKGWNFISTPFKLESGKNNASIFSDVDLGGRSIYTFNAQTATWKAMSESDTILPLEGIWIYSNSTTGVEISPDTDPLKAPPTKKLYAGWNAIGSTGTNPATARDALFSVYEKWSTLIGFDSDKQISDISIINGGSGIFADTRLMTSTKGYWLFMKSSGGDIAAISS